MATKKIKSTKLKALKVKSIRTVGMPKRKLSLAGPKGIKKAKFETMTGKYGKRLKVSSMK